MKQITKRRIFFLLTGAGLMLPPSGKGVGHIVVYASDTRSAGAPPPSTTATLNGSSTLPFGTNTYVLFSNLAAGTHTVEVVTTTSGYLPRESSSTPNAVDDPDSDYGNPRHVVVADDNTVPETFQFDPTITAAAVIRDVWTMDRLEDAAIEFTVSRGPNLGLQYTEFPWGASYASNWLSDATGAIPSNTILYLDDYDLEVSLSGYQTFTSSNIIADASVGDEFNLEEIFLTPIDSNTNRIDDLWETIYFGEGSNVICEADADGDGVCNRDEYIAGTDPTSSLSLLALFHAVSNNTLELTWDTEPCRTYRIAGTTALTTGTWVQVAGPWEAASNQTEMSWAETNMHLSWQSSYRIDVVPCTWTGTNSILLNTNGPSGGGSGGGTNGIPPLP